MNRAISGLTEAQSWVLWALVSMPLASAGDLGLWRCYSGVRCGQILRNLHSKGLVTYVRVGATRNLQRRWFLTRAGVRAAFPSHTGQVPWPITERGLKRLLGRLPMLEAFYSMAPGFLADPMVHAPTGMLQSPDPEEDWIEVPENAQLEEFRWLRSSTIHAVARYHDQIMVPWVWVGVWGPSADWDDWGNGAHLKRLTYQRHTHVQIDFTPLQIQDVEPSAWGIVGIDLWAIQQALARIQVPGPKALVLEGEHARGVTCEPCDLDIKDENPLGAVGIPEKLAKWVETDPVISSLNGSLAFKVATTVEQWPAGTRAEIARACGYPKSATGKAAHKLVDAGVLATFNDRFYLGEGGFKAAARRDRLSSKTVRRRFQRFIGTSDHSRQQYKEHDLRMLQLVNVWARFGTPVVAGWRAEVVVPEETTLAPDAMMSMHAGLDDPTWHFVEYERSAVAPSQVIEKLIGYRRFADAKYQLPLLVVCDREDAERTFWRVGQGLSMVTSTYDRVIKSELITEQLMLKSFGSDVFMFDFATFEAYVHADALKQVTEELRQERVGA